MEAKTKETTVERLKWHINHLEEIGQDFDSRSWGMQAGILITGNEAKEFLALYERVRELEAINKELVAALENAQKLLGMAAAESLREEIKRYLSGGYAETIQNAVFKDSLGIESVLSKARKEQL